MSDELKGARHSASFRDPSGYVFIDNNEIYRRINPIYFKQFDHLNKSGLYQKLVEKKLLIPHTEETRNEKEIIIKHEKIPFFTYPYEWSALQFKQAAQLTLKVQHVAMQHNMVLKDASAYNITFHNGRPIFVDTLSFDFYEEGKPWHAYSQFISHFLAPLVLTKYYGNNIIQGMSSFIDGIPLDVASKMLPFKTKLKPFLYFNIHLSAKYQQKYKGSFNEEVKSNVTRKSLYNVIKNMNSYIKDLKFKEDTEWGDYYDDIKQGDVYLAEKETIIKNWTKNLQPKVIWDVGGNNGKFGRSIYDLADFLLISDIDSEAVGLNYRIMLKQKETKILPMVSNILSPSPGIGFNNKERDPFLKRIKALQPDVSYALALIHHLTLTGNAPFEWTAALFSEITDHLVIEFIDRDDYWVEKILEGKREFKDHFDFYNKANFENEYSQYFDILEQKKVADTSRTLYLMQRKK